MELNPISILEFNKVMLRPKSALSNVNFELYFKQCIEEFKVFAVAPYFWLIPDQANMSLVAVSDNIKSLTPYAKEEWLNKDAWFWLSNIHPDDQGFLGAAISTAVKFEEKHKLLTTDILRLNIYCRMLDANSNYRWVLLQFPKKYFNTDGEICSTLILTTDLSHLKTKLKCMMTLIDWSGDKIDFFSTDNPMTGLTKSKLQTVTKREHEVLQLMAKGLNSPQIAEQLFLSYHTVENHKRNLRRKTNTKTSAELINYVWENNLI